MGRKAGAGKIVLYLAIGVVVSVCLLILFAWFRPTPAPDREVLFGLAVSGGGSRATLFAAGDKAVAKNEAKIRKFLEVPL